MAVPQLNTSDSKPTSVPSTKFGETYTSVLVRKIGRIFSYGNHLGFSPLKWNEKRGTLIVLDSLTSRLYYLFCSLLLTSRLLYGLFSSVYRIVRGDKASDDIGLHLMYSNAYISLSIFNFIMYWRRRELAACFNNLVKLDQQVTELRSTTKKTCKSLLPLITDLFMPITIIDAMACVGISVVDPQNIRHIFWPLHDKSPHAYLFWGVAEFHLTLFAHFDMVVCWLGYMILFSYSLLILLRKVEATAQCHVRGSGSRTQDWIASRKAYQTLSIWTALYNDCVSPMWPVLIWMNVFTHVLFVYITVGHFYALKGTGPILFPSWSVLWIPFEMFIYHFPGMIEEASVDCLRSLRRKAYLAGVNHRCWRYSLQPLKIRVGLSIKIEKHSPMLILAVVSNITVNLLISKRR